MTRKRSVYHFVGSRHADRKAPVAQERRREHLFPLKVRRRQASTAP